MTSQSCFKNITCMLDLYFFGKIQLKMLPRIMLTPEGKMRPAGNPEPGWHGCSLLGRRLVPSSVD